MKISYMDFKKWAGRSVDSEFILDPELIRTFEEKMNRNSYMVEKGDDLTPFGHWLYIEKNNEKSFEVLCPGAENQSVYWYSGKIEVNEYLKIGDTYKSYLKVISTEAENDESLPVKVKIHKRINTGNKMAIEEEQVLLISDNTENQETKRRIDFSPDWELEISSEQMESVKSLSPSFLGHPVTDMLNLKKNKKDDQLCIQGSSLAVLVFESFNYHFESRKIESFEYRTLAFGFEGELFIACRDTDAYQSSMRIINQRRQVLFSAEIKWSYSWDW
ncbi:MAG: hypothetical protein ACFCU6_05675 [Balneolaceae bacterium]